MRKVTLEVTVKAEYYPDGKYSTESIGEYTAKRGGDMNHDELRRLLEEVTIDAQHTVSQQVLRAKQSAVATAEAEAAKEDA